MLSNFFGGNLKQQEQAILEQINSVLIKFSFK